MPGNRVLIRLLPLLFLAASLRGPALWAEEEVAWPQRNLSLVTAAPDQTLWGAENPEAVLLQELASQLSRELGAAVSLRREPAGQGLAAANLVAGARPDGHLFGALPADAAMVRVIQGLTPYVRSEFQPVGLGWSPIYALIALDKLPYSTLAEVAAGTAAGRVRLAHGGLSPAGADTVLALKAALEKGFTWNMVEFKNLDPGILLAGEAEVMVWPLATLFTHPDAEHLKVIALLNPDRAGAAADIGSFAGSLQSAPFEPGCDFYFPARTGGPAVEVLAASLRKILGSSWALNFMKDNYLNPRSAPFPGTAEALEAEYKNQEALLRQLGLL